MAELPDIVDNATVVGTTTAASAARCRSRAPASTSRRRCSPSRAGRPARPSAPTAPAPSCWPPPAPTPVRSAHGPRRLRGLAAGRPSRRGAWTARCSRSAPPWAGCNRSGVIERAGRPGPARRRVADGGGVSVRARSGRARRTVLGRRRRGARSPGCRSATERAHLVRAAIEGIAAQVAWLARAAGEDLGRPLERLRVDGGLTRSRTLLQVQADLLQAPVEVYPSPHATALGVAAFARLGPVRRHRAARPRCPPGSPPPSSSRPIERRRGRAAPHRLAGRGRGHTRPVSDRRAGRGPTFDVAIVGAGVVGAAVPRLLSHHRLRVVAGRGGGRRRRRHQQGQHGHPPHRLRRHAGDGRSPAGRPRLRAAAATTPPQSGIAVEATGAVLVAWDEDQAERAPRAGRQGRRQRLHRQPRSLTLQRSTTSSRTSASGARGRAAHPRRAHHRSVGDHALAFATEAVLNGVELRRSQPGHSRSSPPARAIALQGPGRRRCGLGSW